MPEVPPKLMCVALGHLASASSAVAAIIGRYQIQNGVPDKVLGGTTALLKVSCSKTYELCAREASQVRQRSASLAKILVALTKNRQSRWSKSQVRHDG